MYEIFNGSALAVERLNGRLYTALHGRVLHPQSA